MDAAVPLLRPGGPPPAGAAPAPTPAPQRTRLDEYAEMTGIEPGYLKPAPVAWYASHRHSVGGANEPYAFCYLFAYVFDVPAGAKTLTLPNNDKIRILAITAVEEGPPVSRGLSPLRHPTLIERAAKPQELPAAG